MAVLLDYAPENGPADIILHDLLVLGCFLHGITSLIIEWPRMVFFQPFTQISGGALRAVAEERRCVFAQGIMALHEFILFSAVFFQHCRSPLIFVSARLSAGLACGHDADGLCHDTDVVGNGSSHIGLVPLRDLAEGIVDFSQDFLLLFLAHGITSGISCFVAYACT
jgi:hypothetical protein